MVKRRRGTDARRWAARRRSSSSPRSAKRPSNRPTNGRAGQCHHRAGHPGKLLGFSRLAREANNYFGIKAQTRERLGGLGLVRRLGSDRRPQRGAVPGVPGLQHVAESFVDHGLFFRGERTLRGGHGGADDPRQFAREINRAGYATDPAYASKLIGLMDRYDLYRYDDV